MFRKYKISRNGLFLVEKKDCKYIHPGGWEKEKKHYTIFGECELWYHNLKSDGRSDAIHKTRLIKWLDIRLQLDL
jgi:hypothetical protein